MVRPEGIPMTDPQDLLAQALATTPAERERVAGLLARADRACPGFWEPEEGVEMRVPVEGADIRVFACRPRAPVETRPVVLVPGWGVTPEGFQAFYQSVRGKAEFYYIETREKASSRVSGSAPDMSPAQSARDIAAALESIGLPGKRDFVLAGVCWGSTLILQGLLDGVIDAPTILVGDPMHRLWVPRWVLRSLVPLAPAFLLGAARWLIALALIGDMKEKTQKARDYAFVRAADPLKWKRSASAARDLELLGVLGKLAREVFVVNATTDKVHDQVHYPRIAAEMPRGRFLYLPTDESNRERCMGAAALEFARVSAADGLPPSLDGFERRVR
jgi:hypothetical protein